MGDAMMKMFVLLAVVGMFFTFGCLGAAPQNPPMPGSDADAHGCMASAGYSWCEAKGKCIRSWEENCTVAPQIAGNGTDSHGCKGSEGYTWCEAKKRCLNILIENCTAAP